MPLKRCLVISIVLPYPPPTSEIHLYNTEGTYNQVLQYSTPLNTYGGDIPADDTQSCVYVSPVTVTLPEGTYFVEVSFDGVYQIGDVVLVHSAYLTKN